MENAVLFLWQSWDILGRVVAFLAIVVFLLGIENLAVKLVADIDAMRRRRSAPSIEMLTRKQEDRAAILIPILGPAPLGGTMLARIGRLLDYENYAFFVGVEAADAQTIAAVRREARADRRIRLCEFDSEQAGSRAHALNALLACVRTFERGHDADFQTYVFQGPDTILHPLSLKLINWHCEFASVVQLPVLTGARGSLPLVGGAGFDNLGEHRARELMLRARMIHTIPVLETGIALRRDAVWALRQRGDVFDPASDSPMREAVRRLNARGHLTRFAWQADADGTIIVADELAPRGWREAVRIKASRLLADAASGGHAAGQSKGSLWTHFFDYRDRRTVIVAATFGCALLALLAAALLLVAGHFTPGFEAMPALVDAPWVLALLAANLGFLGASLVERIVLTARTRGNRAAALLPVNLLCAALTTASAVLIASRAASTRRDEDGPGNRGSVRAQGGFATFLAGKAKITDILVHAGAMTKDDADLATAYSRRTGRPLSLALQDLRLVDNTAIAKALGEKLGLAFRHIDGPLDSYASVFLSRHEAERFCAFAERAPDGGVDVYVGEDYSMREWRALRSALRRAGVARPNFKTAPLGDIAYAIRFAGTAQEMAVEQAIAVNLMDGPILEGTARDIRRQLRAPYRRLEDMIVERGLIRPRRMRLARRRIGLTGLEEIMREDRRIPPITLAETVREFNDWRPAIAPLTSFAPMARLRARADSALGPRLAA